MREENAANASMGKQRRIALYFQEVTGTPHCNFLLRLLKIAGQHTTCDVVLAPIKRP